MTEHAGVAGGHELIHWAAALVLVVGGTAFLILSAFARRCQGRSVGAAENDSRPAVVIATASGRGLLGPTLAGLSLGAGVIHVAAAPHHYAEFGDLGAGFIAAGIFQVAWARQALRGFDGAASRALRIGLAGNLGIIAAWVVARTIGLPVGSVEAIGLPDGAATVFEALIVFGLGGILVGPVRSRLAALSRIPAVASIASVAIVPLLGVVMLVTSLATIAIAAGADHGRPADGPPALGLPDHAGHDAAAGLRTTPAAP